MALHEGLKVILLAPAESTIALKQEYSDYVFNNVLQIFDYNGDISLKIIDGDIEGHETDFKRLSEAVPQFNSEQYSVEHSTERTIIITASAGTGKTSVMIDRILYLIDAEGVDPSKITMMTFTNEATNQMMSRLQEAIITRFKLTSSVKYIELLESSSRINISTIDSFSYRLLRTIGHNIGYSSNLSISSDAIAVDDALSQIMDDSYIPGRRVKECLGTNLYKARALIKNFRLKLASLGIVGDDVKAMDWGKPLDEDSMNLQKTLIKGISEMEWYLGSHRLEENTVALTDLVPELSRSLDSYEEIPDLDLEYLFVDEFQDTSDDQIRLISNMAARSDISLFVVGDPKQSIYRFRGADDSAFDTLIRSLKNEGICNIAQFSLVNNYRTDARVLNEMNAKFHQWSIKKLLPKFDPLVPCRGNMGGVVEIKRIHKNNLEGNLSRDLRIALNDVASRKKTTDTKLEKVVVLVRSNRQLDVVAKICDYNNIPLITRRDKPLYTSDAVRDLYAMLSSYVHPDDPISLFGYLETAYSPKNITLDFSKLSGLNGDQANLLQFLNDIIGSTEWELYRCRFKNEPALSVIRDMLDDIPIIDNYISKLKSTRDTIDESILEIRAREYRANLDKILALLHSRFAGDGLDLLHIQQFLSISIATNRDELEEELDFSDLNVAYCMTVHKAKGLEFDTVIIPFDKRLFLEQQTEIVISSDRRSVGWLYCIGDKGLRNSLFERVKGEDLSRTEEEETRILYVAMTRAKRNLVAYTYWHDDGGYCWSALLEE